MIPQLYFAGFLLALTTSLCLTSARAQFATSFPGAIPLFQKTPHFGSWISAANGSLVANAAPFGWTELPQNYVAYVQVRDRQWQWLGYRDNGSDIWNATALGVSISPTRTVLTMQAGPVSFNATFLTPIEPHNMSTLSFPFVYLSIEAWTTDNVNYNAKFYVEAAATFVRGVSVGSVTWNTTRTNELVYHQMFDPQPVHLSEDKDTVGDGTLYFASTAIAGLSHQAGVADEVRNRFLTQGSLTNDMHQDSRVIDKNNPVLAFAATVEATPTKSSPVVFALGYVRDPVVRYAVDGGVELRHSYFWTEFPKFEDALHAFIAGFPKAMENAVALDTRIMNDAGKVSTDYADLVALSLRQTMGAIEITSVQNSDGSWKDKDVKIFMRDNGIGRRTNAVETVYASFPTFLYLNPELARYLLEPLLDYQNSPVYRNNYAAPDLGTSYPDVLGNNTDTLLYAIENCGFMLTMSLAYAMKSGDGTLLHENYNILKTWGDYLVTYTMRADGYVSSDGLRNNGLTNMALGGIAGIYAMGKINEALEPQGMLGNFTRHFVNTATQYATEWESRAYVNNRIASTYGSGDTWTMAHNLFAMKLINGNYIKDSVLDGRAAHFKDLLENSNYRYGIPFDLSSQETFAKTRMLDTYLDMTECR
ncbi:hypothetical protein BJ165DRAFT_260171 [Panaeolus papilionaceus]|nr:hypothetical protein BJ165DRAFT_260171 [Panaeolus papilionaceus]